MRIIVFISLLIAITHANVLKVDLTSNWSLKNINGSILLSNLSIPLSVHNALLDARLIGDPLYRYNDVELRWIAYEPIWTFKTYFKIDESLINTTNAIFEFNSIDTVSKVYLNDEFLFATQNQFLKYTTKAVNAYLTKDINILEIQIESAVLNARTIAKQYPYRVPVDCPVDVQHGECHVNFLRKEQCSFSWDWGPAFAPVAINDVICLKFIEKFDFQHSIATYPVSVGNLNEWNIDIKIDITQNLPLNSNTFTLIFAIPELDFKFSTEIERPDVGTFSFRCKRQINSTVELWYPRDYGDQPMYDYNVIVSISDSQIEKNGMIAFRSVELVQEKIENATGLTFYFKINNQPVFLKGTNWIPMNVFKDRLDEDYLDWLYQAIYQSNMNVLRVWGGGVYENEEFYNIADKMGILIWQDFMFACSMYPTNDDYLNNVQHEVEYQLYRLRSHPSIIAWSGNNENEAALADNWYSTDLDKSRYENDYRKLYIDTIRVKVLDVEPVESRPFISSSPSNGLESETENWLAKNPYDPNYGDVHFYNYQMNAWDAEAYPVTRFMSEFGFQSLPSVATLSTAYDPTQDFSLFSRLNNHRQHHKDGNQEILLEISTHFSNLPDVNDFNSVVYLSQINQAMSLKTGVEVCRRYRDRVDSKTSNGRCMGIMYWQLNDVWVAPTWSSVEYGGKWKLAHYFIKNSYSNLLISPLVNAEKNTIDVYLIADRLEKPVDNKVIMSVYKFNSFDAQYSENYDFTIESSSSQVVQSIDVKNLERKTGCKFNDEYFKCLVMFTFENDENLLSGENFLFTFNKFHNFKYHQVKVTEVVQLSNKEFMIELETDRISLFVWLDTQDSKYIGYFSDNGFHMVESTRSISFTAYSPNYNVDDLRASLVVSSITFA